MKISYNEKIDISISERRPRGKWAPIIKDFMCSNNQNICMEFETVRERDTAYNSIFQGYIQRKKIKGIVMARRGLKVYVIKKGEKEKQ